MKKYVVFYMKNLYNSMAINDYLVLISKNSPKNAYTQIMNFKLQKLKHFFSYILFKQAFGTIISNKKRAPIGKKLFRDHFQLFSPSGLNAPLENKGPI